MTPLILLLSQTLGNKPAAAFLTNCYQQNKGATGKKKKKAHGIVSPLCITSYKGSFLPWHNAKAPNAPHYLTLAYFTGCFFYHSPLGHHAGVTRTFFLKHTEFVLFPRPVHQLFLLPGVFFTLFCTLLPLLSFRKLKYYPFREIFFEHKI